MQRRTLLLGAAAGLLGAAAILRPKDQGENHAPFFENLSKALDEVGRSGPTLVVDRQRMLANAATLVSHKQQGVAYRVVAKSLPSLPMLADIMQATDTRRLMLFHQPFINQAVRAFPDTDVLLGKPMPVAAARNFYQQHAANEFDTSSQLHWLIDTAQRAREYDALARDLGTGMSVVVEIDVGLHRGGTQTDAELVELLDVLQSSEQLRFDGFMGYEPHIVKVPGDPIGHRDKAMQRYTRCIEVAREQLGEDWPDEPILNAAGSPTYQLYDDGDYPFNEIAAGSCLVKPTDFDIPTLSDHQVASWIATPVLKSSDRLQVPGLNLGPLMSAWDPNRARSFFTYGGYWKAIPESPRGLSNNPLMGRSTNQELFNGSNSIDLAPDDWIFLRPTQSEFVFLQFGNIAVYENGSITEAWPVLNQNV